MKVSILVLAALVVLSVQQTCKEGACCDLKTNTLRPKGYPCNTNPCTETVSCTGTNPFCPIGNVPKVPFFMLSPFFEHNFQFVFWSSINLYQLLYPFSILLQTNGTICPDGVCFNGKCKQATPCVGDCCDRNNVAKVFYITSRSHGGMPI